MLRLTEADVNVRLYLSQVRVTPSIHLDLMSEMKRDRKVASYPTVRGEIRTCSHPTDNHHFGLSNPFHNNLPNRLVVVLLKQATFNGSVTHTHSILRDSI